MYIVVREHSLWVMKVEREISCKYSNKFGITSSDAE
jgi:hypothetical protein